MRPSHLHWYVLGLIAWLVVGIGVCLAWGAAIANQSRGMFDQDTRILHRVLSQRAEQHEAVLSSLVALEGSKVSPASLKDFAGAMRARYPQIEVIERCARAATVAQGRCLPLSGSASSLEPGLAGQAFRAALEALPERPVGITARAAYDPARPRFALSQASSASAFVLWIDATRFVSPDEFTYLDARLDLNASINGARLFERPPQQRPLVLEVLLLPRFRLAKTLGSTSQPFILRAERPFRFSELPFAWMIAFLVGGTLPALLLVRLLLLAREARLERVQAEAALGRERARAEGTVRAVSEALFTCDRDGIITLVNPAAQALLGADATAMLGRPLGTVVRLQGTLGGQPLGAFLGTFWQRPQVTDLPEGATLLDHHGQARLVEGSLSPLDDEHGQFAGAVLACRDLGPFRRRMLEALELSERRVREHEATLAHVGRVSTLSEIAAGVAHELNQPLTAILSHSQASLRLLEDGEASLPQVRRSLQSSAEQARRASQILERLRAHAARQPLRRERIDLRQLVENVRVLTEHELRQRGIRLETRFGAGALEVVGDAIQLEQVLHNLVRNAIEAVAGVAPERRLIRLVALGRSNTVLLEVRDFGPGIAAEVLPRLFTPFVSGKPGGLGLGLSLSQTLVQGMGGTLAGENAADGGARFVLTLPALRPEAVRVER